MHCNIKFCPLCRRFDVKLTVYRSGIDAFNRGSVKIMAIQWHVCFGDSGNRIPLVFRSSISILTSSQKGKLPRGRVTLNVCFV